MLELISAARLILFDTESGNLTVNHFEKIS